MKYPAARSHSVKPLTCGGGTAVERMWCEPMDVGYMPVMIPERAGAQTGVTAKARVKRAPSAASRSRFGVTAYASP